VTPIIEWFVPGALRNPLNGSFSRAHWSAKSRWAKEWKARTVAMMTQQMVATQLLAVYGEPLGVILEHPKRVSFLAHTGAPWDDDAIPAGCKPIRDALIGYAIHSDAPDSGHVFEYAQVVNRKRRGVLITITPR
jgi:hypothetical protein